MRTLRDRPWSFTPPICPWEGFTEYVFTALASSKLMNRSLLAIFPAEAKMFDSAPEIGASRGMKSSD
ncbi:MAG: hypothetical protein ABI380_12310 [Edaphobacter sp.]